MLRGLYSAANAMRYREHEIDVVTNNLANVSTDGFKRDRVALRSFGDLLASRINDQGDQPLRIPPSPKRIGVMNLGGAAAETEFVDFSQGTQHVTGNPLDLYLNGPGFFGIDTPNGVRYTRSGAFSLSDTGELLTQSGFRVLGTDSNPIRITAPEPIQIMRDGEIRQSNVPVGRIMVVEFDDLSMVEKEGLTLFNGVAPSQPPPHPATETFIEQGTIELSNVDAIQSLVHLITAQRAYEAAARAVDMFNESLSRVSGELGRLPA